MTQRLLLTINIFFKLFLVQSIQFFLQGSALGTMVGLLTYGNKKFETLDSTIRRILPPLHHTMNDLIPMIDADSSAFCAYMAALKLPKNTPEEAEK